tara:strand:+ start:940 stop:2352 length:1413 start_codon:yes stop_codon:yes gene_type:complete
MQSEINLITENTPKATYKKINCKAINNTTQQLCKYTAQHESDLCGIHIRQQNIILNSKQKKKILPLTKVEICNLNWKDTKSITRPVIQCTLASFGITKKLSQRKSFLIERLISLRQALLNENKVVQIQRWFRYKIWNLIKFYHGAGWINRKKCTNLTEFLTFDNITEIPERDFITHKENGHIYGFTVDSIHTLFQNEFRNNRFSPPKNPYTRVKLTHSLLDRAGAILKCVYVSDKKIHNKCKIISRCKLFYLDHSIDKLCKEIKQKRGFSIKPCWIKNLSLRKIKLAYGTFQKIWRKLSPKVQTEVIPGYGNLFSMKRLRQFYQAPTKQHALYIIYDTCKILSKTENNDIGIIIICAVLWVVCRQSRADLSWASDIDFGLYSRKEIVQHETQSTQFIPDPVADPEPVADPMENVVLEQNHEIQPISLNIIETINNVSERPQNEQPVENEQPVSNSRNIIRRLLGLTMLNE